MFKQVVNDYSEQMGSKVLGGGDSAKVMSRTLAEHMWVKAFPPLDVECAEGQPLFAIAVPPGENSVRLEGIILSMRDELGQTTNWQRNTCTNETSCHQGQKN